MATKKNDSLKQLRYDRRKDPNSNCYLDTDGSYVFTQDVQRGNRWEKEEVFRFHPDDFPNGAEIILALSEGDRAEDEQADVAHEHTDKVFQKKLGTFESAGNDSQVLNPWDEVAFDHGGRDVHDAAFPEEETMDPRLAEAEAFIDTLEPQQVDLLYAHLGERKYLEDIRREMEEETGKKVTQQALSNRWNKIVAKGCRYFGVEKPRKRKRRGE